MFHLFHLYNYFFFLDMIQKVVNGGRRKSRHIRENYGVRSGDSYRHSYGGMVCIRLMCLIYWESCAMIGGPTVGIGSQSGRRQPQQMEDRR